MKRLNLGWLRLDLFGGAELEQLRRIVESAPNAMLLVDRGGCITMVNAQMERMFGYTRQELLGQPVETLVPARFRGSHPGYRTGFFANPSPRAMGAGRDLFGLHKDGHEFPIEIGLSPIESRGQLTVLASIIDITARKQAEERFRRVVRAPSSAFAALGAKAMIGVDQMVLAMQSINQASTQNVASTRQAESAAQNLHGLGLSLKQLVEQHQM